MERIRRMIKNLNSTLLELLVGIIFWGIIFQGTVLWFVQDKKGYSTGLWIGVILAVFLAQHMWKTLDEALTYGEADAQKIIRKETIIRYLIAVSVFCLIMIFKAANPLAAFLGVMTLKVAAYVQPITHKIISKLRR